MLRGYSKTQSSCSIPYSLHSLAWYSSLAACAILITFNSSRHFDFSQDAFSKLRVPNFDKRRTKVAKRNCEFTKALSKLTNYCDKAILLTNQWSRRQFIRSRLGQFAFRPGLLSTTTHSLWLTIIYLVIDIGPRYEFDSYRFTKEELDLTHSLVFVTSKTRES